MEESFVREQSAREARPTGGARFHHRRKFTMIAGLLGLALLAFVTGGILMGSASAAGTTDPKGNAPSGAAGGGNVQKAALTVVSVNSQSIRGKRNDGSTVTVTITSQTVFTSKDGKTASLSDVKVGTVIGAIGSITGNGSMTATQVIIGVEVGGVKNGPPAGDEVSGKITAISATTITIQSDGKSVIVKTTASTRYIDKQAGKDLSRSDLKVGDEIVALGVHNSDGSLTARFVGTGIAQKADQSAGQK